MRNKYIHSGFLLFITVLLTSCNKPEPINTALAEAAFYEYSLDITVDQIVKKFGNPHHVKNNISNAVVYAYEIENSKSLLIFQFSKKTERVYACKMAYSKDSPLIDLKLDINKICHIYSQGHDWQKYETTIDVWEGQKSNDVQKIGYKREDDKIDIHVIRNTLSLSKTDWNK